MDYSLYIQRPIMAHKNDDGTYTALIFGGQEYYEQTIPKTTFERAYESYSSTASIGMNSVESVNHEWVRPSRSNPYKKGVMVTYAGRKYENLYNNNILNPDEFPQGWKEVID